MVSRLKVGLAAVGGSGWLGGVTFVELLVKALAQLPRIERPETYFIINDSALAEFNLFRPSAELSDRIAYVGAKRDLARKVVGEHVICCHSYDELFNIIDIYLPINSGVANGWPAISWIPDFQHTHLPEFFSSEEIVSRDKHFRTIAETAKMLIVSSQAVEDDFRRMFPDSQTVTRVLSYRLSAEADWYLPDPAAVSRKYQLPDRFILCCNQFWIHKNHKVLFDAVARLRSKGHDVHVVCTGKTSDYRWPDYFSELVDYIRTLGIEDLVHILGLIPRGDQIQLIRRSLCVVQPSLFEGLSLIVCETRALGKPIIVSDIPVHREQEYGIFFEPSNVYELSQKISEITQCSTPGPDTSMEEAAKMEASNQVGRFARECVNMMETAAQVFDLPVEPSKRKEITVATSLMPGSLEIQKNAIASWRKLGFRVISLNAPDEVECLSPLFPEVEFARVERDARVQYGKPFVFFDDVLACLSKAGSQICGIVNSDITLDHAELKEFITKEAPNSILFGCRIETSAENEREGTVNIGGYDFFFFDRKIMDCYPKEEFCIGLPWWDYWVVLCPLAKGFQTKKMVTPVAFHIRHETSWGGNSWFPLGQCLSKYVSLPFPVNNQTMIDFQRIIHHTLENRSEHVEIT